MTDRLTATSVWIIIPPMLISIYIASIMSASVFANVIDSVLFSHHQDIIRSWYISFAIFIAFSFSSFCIAISTYIAVPKNKVVLMNIVVIIPLLWPKLIMLYLFPIENHGYVQNGFDLNIVMFIIGTLCGGIIAYFIVKKLTNKNASNGNTENKKTFRTF